MIREVDLFGAPISAPAKPRPQPSLGYAARPGTGPKGQRCNTCRHCMLVSADGQRVRRCELTAPKWDRGAQMDIKHNAPACKHWERKEYAKKHASL